MSVPISNVPRRVVLAASGTGPYSFNFEILAAGDISVYKDDDLLTLTTDYTVTINGNGTGFVTLVATPIGATQIAIVGDRAIQRTTDFTTGGDLFATSLNDELDSQTIFAQQNAEAVERALKAPQTDPLTIDMTLPRASERANKYLAFDADGNPQPGDTSQDIATVAANIDNINIVKGQITPVNNIATVAGANANITTVAGNIANVNAVGAISSNVTTVAGIAANVTTVAGIAANVTTVATNVADITNYADTYLGPKSSDPSVRNDNSALQAGDLYFNTVDDVMKVYTGSAWTAAYVPSDEFLVAANNLSELTNVTTAQQNLDLEVGVDVQAYDANLTALANYGVFRKADPTIVAWSKTGAFTVSTATTLYVEVNGAVKTIASSTAVTMPGSATTGTDYAIWAKTDGTLEATNNHTSPPATGARKVGGFHYAPGSNAAAQDGGDTTPQINEYSFWDLKFRPACPDPRGMTLVAGGFWADIYLCGVNHYTNGTSKYNVTIADGSAPPKIPAQFGGNGSTAYSNGNWWNFAEVMRSWGKRLPTYSEFAALAYGVKEAHSIQDDPINTGLVNGSGSAGAGEDLNANKYTSKWGVIQATGNLYTWGDEFGGGAAAASWTANTGGRGSTYQMENAVILGGSWGNAADSGSRCSAWNNSPTVSANGGLGGRGVCDHLLLD